MSEQIYTKVQGKFFRNALSGFVAGNLNALMRIIEFAILVRLLDLEPFGMILLAGYVINQITTFDGGVLQSLEKFVPHYSTEKRYDLVAATISLGLGLMLLIGVGFALILLSGLYFGWLYWLPHNDSEQLAGACLVAALLVPLLWPVQALRNVAFGYLNHHHVYLVDLAVTGSIIILSVAGALAGLQATELILIRALPVAVSLFPLLASIRRAHQGPILNFRKPDILSVASDSAPYTGWVLTMKAALVVKFVTERVVPAAVLGVAGVPLYDALLKVVTFVVGLNNGFKQVALPLASGLSRLSRAGELETTTVYGTNAMAAMFAPVLVLLAVFMQPVMVIMGGAEFRGLAEGLSVELILLSLLIFRAFTSRLLMGQGDQMAGLTLWAIVSNLTYLAFTYVLLHTGGAEWGIVAHALSHLVWMPWFLGIVARSKLVPVGRLLSAAMRGLLPSWVLGLVAFMLLRTLDLEPVSMQMALMLAVVSVIVLFASFHFGLYADTRTAALNWVKNLRAPR